MPFPSGKASPGRFQPGDAGGSFFGNGWFLYDATYVRTGPTIQLDFNGSNSALQINDVIESTVLPQQFRDTFFGAVGLDAFMLHRFISGTAWPLGNSAATNVWHQFNNGNRQIAAIANPFTNTSRYFLAEAGDGTLVRASAVITMVNTP